MGGIIEVARSFQACWTWPDFGPAREFSRYSIPGKGEPSLYGIARNTGRFHGAENNDLERTYQEARNAAWLVYRTPPTPYMNGPVYMVAANNRAYWMEDCVTVGLMRVGASFRNRYYYPASNPTQWTQRFVIDAYQADPNDHLRD